MARYRGPKQRISRRYGAPVFGPHKVLEKRAYPPGQHGPRSRRKLTDYARGLAEKQKLRYCYGLLERQFRRIFNLAKSRRGNTSETMLQLLETRLDNVTFRLGFGLSRPQARQLVNHGHVKVNGRAVNVPSYNVKAGDVIEVRDNARSRQMVGRGLESATVRTVPDWLSLNKEGLKANVLRMPTVDEIQPIANVQAIVEFYSR
ncbi:MAG: 30S ribosomal protein S4 [Verrucomicrobia bacterium]|nr:30S ribosomal protein S4 [Verrucomicrobiota bacterium]